MAVLDSDGLLYFWQKIKVYFATKDTATTSASGLMSAGDKTKLDGLATVATSGSYNDLANKPNIPAGVVVDTAMSASSGNAVQNKVIKSYVDAAQSSAQTYADGKVSALGSVLSYKGTVENYAALPTSAKAGDTYNVTAAYGTTPAGTNYTWSGSTWDALGGTVDLSGYATTASLSTVATSGSYNDLANKPTIPAAVTVDSSMSSTSTNPVQNKVVNSALSAKAALASPTFTGTPKAPTAAAGTNTTQIATTAFVTTAASATLASAKTYADGVKPTAITNAEIDTILAS